MTDDEPWIFITGTDTGVGKTVVSAALVRRLVQMRCSVGVMKPVEPACNPTRLMRATPVD